MQLNLFSERETIINKIIDIIDKEITNLNKNKTKENQYKISALGWLYIQIKEKL